MQQKKQKDRRPAQNRTESQELVEKKEFNVERKKLYSTL